MPTSIERLYDITINQVTTHPRAKITLHAELCFGGMNAKKKISFLCTHNAARSQMAEGFVNALYSDRYKAFSAGNEPTEVHPCTIAIMTEVEIDISAQRAKSLDELEDQTFDYVVTLCADVQESCPIFPGGVEYLHHTFVNPGSAPASDNNPCAPFRLVRDQIKEWLEATFGKNSSGV
jgi:arsenate reductase (thioredoxin)